MPDRVRFVTATGPAIGRGHLARTLSMAEARWRPGTELELDLLEGSMTEREIARLDTVGGRRVAADAAPAAGSRVVLDIPAPDAVAGRLEPGGLVVFDDQGSLRCRAALVVQPSQPAWDGSATVESVLEGYDFVPVSAAVRAYRSRAVSSRADGARARPRLLVCFGGSDPDRVTDRLVPAIARSVDADVQVVIGASYTGSTDGWPVAPRRDPPDLVEQIATSDVVVLGAGTMKFEAACLGRAMLLVAAADDQLAVGPAFAATGAARYLGDGRTIEPRVVADAVTTLLRDAAARAALGSAAARLVDGAGADRVAAAIQSLPQATASS